MFWSDPQLQSNPLRTMRTLKDLGVQVVRTSIIWGNVAAQYAYPSTKPTQLDATDPGSYPADGWTTYDAIDRAAAATGIRLYFTVTGPGPRWAAGPGAPTTFGDTPWEPSAADFGEFVRAVGKRYDGHYRPAGATSPLPRVDFWSIWNEPNYGTTLQPQVNAAHQPVSPRMYRELVDAAWSSLQATGHTPATDTILIGETAPYGTEPDQVGAVRGMVPEMVPLTFIRGLYCLGSDYAPLQGAAATQLGCPASSTNFKADNPGLFDASGWADHPYTGGNPPSMLTTGLPGSADFADFPAISHLEDSLDRAAAAYGSTVQFPIYNTEFGFQTNPPNVESTTTSLGNAATYMNQAEYLSWRNPRIRSFNQYELIDQNAKKHDNFDTGLEFFTSPDHPFDGRPKPSYEAYRMPLWMPETSAARGHHLEVWGCARAAPVVAHRTGQSQNVEIQFAQPAGRYRTIATVTLDPASAGCYFDTFVRFPGSGTVRLAWKDGSTFQHSRVQAITVS